MDAESVDVSSQQNDYLNANPLTFTIQELKALFFFIQTNLPYDINITDYGKRLMNSAYCKIGEELTGVPCGHKEHSTEANSNHFYYR